MSVQPRSWPDVPELTARKVKANKGVPGVDAVAESESAALFVYSP